jgi:O-antigen/teichoic acid export membrane protein
MIRLARLLAWRPGRLAWNTAHAGGWSGVRVAVQAASLVLLARLFGADGYGVLAGTLAFYITLAQFVGLGTGIAFLRHSARSGGVSRLGATQLVYLLTGLGFFLVAWPASLWLFGDEGIAPSTLAVFAIAELVVAPALQPLAYRYQAIERMSVSGGLLTAAPIARCVAMLVAWAIGTHSLQVFSQLYLACLVATVASAMALWPRTGSFAAGVSIPAEIRDGIPYAITNVASTAGGELDKTVMLRCAGDLAAGHYAAAARIAQAAILPVNALVVAAAPRWFRSHRRGRVLVESAPLFTIAVAYAVVAGVALVFLAPLVPFLLGPQFLPSVSLLQLFCAFVLTGSLRQVMGMLLTSSDLQRSRNFTEVLSVIVGLSAMPFLIVLFGSPGAILSALAADLLFITFGWHALHKHDRESVSRALNG